MAHTPSEAELYERVKLLTKERDMLERTVRATAQDDDTASLITGSPGFKIERAKRALVELRRMRESGSMSDQIDRNRAERGDTSTEGADDDLVIAAAPLEGQKVPTPPGYYPSFFPFDRPMVALTRRQWDEHVEALKLARSYIINNGDHANDGWIVKKITEAIGDEE